MKNNINSQNLIEEASKLQSEKKFADAMKLLLILSEQENCIAQNELAYMYFQGLGIEANKDTANYWWEKSANLGCPDSQFQIGISSLEKNNFKQAMKWLKLAAKQQHKEALYTLAKLYYKGDTIEKDIELAIKYYDQASLLGHPQASTDLVIVTNKKYGKFRAIKKLLQIMLTRKLNFTN